MKAAAGSKAAAGWATLAAGALLAYEKQDKLGKTAFMEQYALNAGVGSQTLWRHVAAYMFWQALREQGDYGDLPPAEGIQGLVSSMYLVTLRQVAQGSPRATSQRYIHAIRDGQPFDASAFAGAARPLTRGRGASAKIIQQMNSQPEFDAASLTHSIMERLPAWSASGHPADTGGHVLASDMGKIPERLGKPDALFFLINDSQPDDDAELIRLGALTMVPPDLQLGEQLRVLDLAQRSMNIGQSWLGFSQWPQGNLCDVAKAVGVGVLLHAVVEDESRVDVLVQPKPAAANPYVRELVLSKFLRMPANVVMASAPEEPKASGGPKVG